MRRHDPELLRLSRQMTRQAVVNLARNHYADGAATDCAECMKLAELKRELAVMDRRAKKVIHQEVHDAQANS